MRMVWSDQPDLSPYSVPGPGDQIADGVAEHLVPGSLGSDSRALPFPGSESLGKGLDLSAPVLCLSNGETKEPSSKGYGKDKMRWCMKSA